MSKYMKKFIATFIALTFIFNLTQPISGYAQSLEENNFQKEHERERIGSILGLIGTNLIRF